LRVIYIFVDIQGRIFLATLTQFASNDRAALEASTEDLEVLLSGDETMKSKSLSGPRICVCCGERMTRRSENPNICLLLFRLCRHHRGSSTALTEKRRKLELHQEQAAACYEDSPLHNSPELVLRAV